MNILNDIINRSGFLVFIWRIESGKWGIEFVSENVADILGYTADDFISGRVSWPSIIHPDDVPRFEKEAAQYLEKGDRKWSQEYRVITKAGETRWFHDDNFALEDSDGKTIRIQATIHDITEHKRAEEMTKAAHQRLMAILDGVNACVYVADMKSYDVLFINQKLRNILGNVEGKKCWQSLQSGQTGPCDFCTNKRLVDAEGKPTDVYRWEFKNTQTGSWYDCLDNAISWIDGRIVRLEIAIDITGRKRAEDELLKLKTVVEQAADGMVMTDRQDRIVFANTAWADMHGYTVNELIGKDINILHTAEQLRGEVVPFNAIVIKNGSNEGEVGHCRRDGTTFPTWTTSALVKDGHGKPTMLVGMAHDITERKRTNA